MKEGETAMKDITKALQELAKAVENNETVKSVQITITLQKPKASKAKPQAESKG